MPKSVTTIPGYLEIDHVRGVVYFHTNDQKVTEKCGTVTVLRLSNLPTPVPHDEHLDVYLPAGAGWKDHPPTVKGR